MTDLAEFNAQVATIQDALAGGWTGPLKPVSDNVASQYAQEIKVRYDSAMLGDGTWQPLAGITIRYKTWKGYAAPTYILFATGVLRGSFELGGYGNVLRMDNTTFEYGTSIEYAEDHQYGDPDHYIPPLGGGFGDVYVNLPAREMLVIPSDDLQESCNLDFSNLLCELANAA